MAFLGFYPQRSTASDLGQSLGSGLGKGLSALAEQKLQKLQTAQAEKDFINEGYDRSSAKLFSRIMHDPAFKNNPQLLKLIQNYQAPEYQDEGEQPQQVQEHNYLEQFQHPQEQQMQPQMQDFEQVAQSLKNPMGFAQARMGQVPFQPQMQQQQMQQSQRQPLQSHIQPETRKLRAPSFKKQNTLEDQLKQERIQGVITTANKPYNDLLDKRITAANTGLEAIAKMENLLASGNVQSGFYAGNVPANLRGSLLTPESEQFANLGDDVAEALSGLSTGQQTISKINFNRNRKANLSQSHEAQNERVQDAKEMFSKIALESDARNYLIEKNGGQPRDLSTLARNIYNKLENQIPNKPQDAQEGQTFTDPKTGARWKVQGPIMRFVGFKGERNG